jgi:hypothetical protein
MVKCKYTKINVVKADLVKVLVHNYVPTDLFTDVPIELHVINVVNADPVKVLV